MSNINSNMSYEEGQPRNLCCVCKEDLGPQNPRQLCRKSYCPEQFLELDLELDSELPNQSSNNKEKSQSLLPLNDDLMCESCSLKSSQSSLKSSPTSSVPTQDQPTQIVNLVNNPLPTQIINLVNNALPENPPKNLNRETKIYAVNDIRSFLAIIKK